MTPTLILVPGLGDSGPGHWQSLWEHKYGAVRVRQDDVDAPDAAAWSARLHETIEATPGELVLVGHSAGVPTIVTWAARYWSPEAGGHQRVRGALLVAPPDPERPELGAFAPLPLSPLPLPALVVASQNDPYGSFERAGAMAEAWDAPLISAGDAGHINVESGHGEWPDGEVLLSECLHAWTPPDIVRM
jgi:uncharacterized protein